MKKILSILILGCLILCFLFSSKLDVFQNTSNEIYNHSTKITMNTYNSTPNTKEKITTLKEIEPIKKEVTFFAIGDILLHEPLYKTCLTEDGSYNFSHIFNNWENDIGQVDFACVNQETIFVPKEDKYTSYPCFGSPEEIGQTELDVGFDIITHATNHTYDRNTKGLEYTKDYWKDKDTLVLGINNSQEEQDKVSIVEKNGFTFSFLNYTYGLNGFTLPQDKNYLVNVIDEQDKWLAQIKKAKEKTEVVVCFLHIGTEYVDLPTNYQMNKVEQAIDSGADIVICAHPHVIEPFGIYETKNGNSGLVYWSLGNFISNQQDVSTNLGGVATFTIQKTTIKGIDEIKITQANMEGTITQHDEKGYYAIPLSMYSEELANQHILRKKGANFTYDKLNTIYNNVCSNYEKCNTKSVKNLPLIIK